LIRRSLATLGAVTAITVAAGSADGSSSSALVIRPGVSIGQIRIGMTLTQVKRTLGRPYLVSRHEERGFGIRYVEYQWASASWRVGFLGRVGEQRAVRIGTTVRSQRTPEGIGVGSTTKDLARRYGPRVSCVDRDRLRPQPGSWIVLRGPGSSMTAFWLTKANGNGYEPHVRPMVGEVIVQQAWATGGTSPCSSDWQTWRW
jgi:hypothetical protein